jgi:hypothetical protein
MKNKEFLKFYKNQFDYISAGPGEWEFTLKKEDEFGYLRIIPRLLKSPPIQRIEVGVTISPSWYVELVNIIREDKELDHLMFISTNLIPEGGDIYEEHLVDNLKSVYKLYDEKNSPEVISEYLGKIYTEGLTPDRTVWARYFYTCVIKGDVKFLEEELLAKKDSSSKLPPAFDIPFFTNAVRLAKEYRDGNRFCPIKF